MIVVRRTCENPFCLLAWYLTDEDILEIGVYVHEHLAKLTEICECDTFPRNFRKVIQQSVQ
jgi:hypothetical protein